MFDKMDRLNTQLRNRAITLNMCDKVKSQWCDGKSKDELCELYKSQLDFCIENDYPKLDFMKYYFDGVMQNHGIYVDDDVKIRGKGVLVLNGKTKAVVVSDERNVSTIFIRHDSEVKLRAKGHAVVFVRIYDNAKVDIEQSESASVFVQKFGGSVDVIGEARITDRTKS